MRWTRREFLTTSTLMAAGSLGGLPALGRQAAQQAPPGQPAPTPMEFRPLRENVGLFIGQGGTIGWLISPDGVIVVDSQMPQSAAVCLRGINERSANRPIQVLFNTHHHADHTGGNEVFRPAVKKIVAHARVPELQKATAKPGTEATLVFADATFTHTWTERVGKETVTAEHYGPAHTGGDSVVTFERANVVHMGDLVFNRRMPVIDKPGGCRIAGWIALLENVVKANPADSIYVFGHARAGAGVTGRKEDLILQRDFLTALLEFVRAEAKAGKSREEIVKITAELDGFTEHGPLTERVLGGAYDEIVSGA